jgi:hypothetical protein
MRINCPTEEHTMKRVTSMQRTETDGMIRVVAHERDFDAPIGSKDSEATSRVIYEGRDQVAAREAETVASAAMWKAPDAPVVDAAAAAPDRAFAQFVKR